MNTMPRALYTSVEKQACAEREVRMRERVFPKRVEMGKMRADVAGREIAIMKEIAQDYAEAAKRERML